MLFSFRVLLQFQQDGAVQVEMLRLVAVLFHGFLCRQHGQQELSLVETLPGFPVVRRLGPARRHQAQEPGKSPKKNTRPPRIHPTPIGGRIATGIPLLDHRPRPRIDGQPPLGTGLPKPAFTQFTLAGEVVRRNLDLVDKRSAPVHDGDWSERCRPLAEPEWKCPATLLKSILSGKSMLLDRND